MSNARITKRSKVGNRTSPSRGADWAAFDRLTDAEIEKAAAADPDTIPVTDADFWASARLVMPVPKKAISIRLDEDVLGWFRATGPGYQSRINAVLRAYMDAKKDG